jgi:hypothetical protein
LILEHVMNRYVGLVRTGDALMPELVADLPWPSWYHLFSRAGTKSFQWLGRERATRGRSPKGGTRANLTAARDNLYLNLAADLLQVQQTAIDDLNFRL